MYLYNIRAALEQLEHIPDSGGSVLILLLLRQLNNRIQSSLYFAKEGWSKYAFT